MTVSARPGDLGRGRARRDGGVHEARSVEVDAQPELACGRDELAQLVERPDGPAGGVVRVLERDDRRARRPVVALGPRGRAQLLGREAAAEAGQPAGLKPGVEGGAAELGDHDVRPLLDEQLGAAARRGSRSAIWLPIVAVGR